MSFWKFIGELALLEWLFGPGKQKAAVPPSSSPHDYGWEDDYFDQVHSLESRIDELERQQDRYDILSGRYDDLQDEIDDLQDELDDTFYDDF